MVKDIAQCRDLRAILSNRRERFDSKRRVCCGRIYYKKISKDGYDRFLLLLSFESLFEHLDSIEQSLNMLNTSGKNLIDQLFLTGDGANRFISCEFKNGKLDFQTACIVSPADFFRKETVGWLHNHYSFVEHSILTEEQRQKVRDGIAF